jgi:hypothetical protein
VVEVGEVSNGHTTFTQLTGLASQGRFEGAGRFLGNGHDEFIMQNTSGAMVVVDAAGGHTAVTQLGVLGSQWKFVGDGDFLGEGRSAT